MVQITPRVIPDGYEFLVCLTQNTEWTPPEDGFYRITCFGKSAPGTAGETGIYGVPDPSCAGAGGNGGGSGGLCRSVLELSQSKSIHCTVTSSITSFGDYQSATAASGINGGKASGGNDFNADGANGGAGGQGVVARFTRIDSWDGYYTVTNQAQKGKPGGASGARGGSVGESREGTGGGGGGGGGGARYNLPELAYDDPLYTTYIVKSLSSFAGGKGGKYQHPIYSTNDATTGYPGASYPKFSPAKPIWYGGGNGGGGGGTADKNGGAGSPGSPGGILIEKGVFH